ncbi:hypothetical protein O1611_g2578 [Lasiodiplodia mahajangana]|uniref:Uncharacterized protein n=1 Tax=Lasiodiplodia mahajangana TaxID=1108764 RepID=A0ACC2JU34_9PEZI|nr:hypothetical protein O1611_g2578 [Lasiodiplodia mahajangana]
MRVGCLQFAPQVGDVDNNLNRADAVLSKANPENLDLLVLPELAFTGYNFKSLREISPFLEPKGSGISALWARTVALKLNCLVTVGYPEKVDIKPKWPTSPEYYNSVIVVNSDGETIANYRKTFLYYTDETWALEGQEGFYGGFIPGLGNTSMGICMDLNPRKFEAPWHAFEFAFHCLDVEANVIIMTMAWNTREDARMFSRMPNEPDMDTLTYWISRLEPLIRSENQEEIIIIFCNRCGIEDDAVYAGTSAVIGVKDGEVNVYGILGRGEKDLLVVDTEKPPCAKLVYRPDDQASPVASAHDSVHSFQEIGQMKPEKATTATPSESKPSPKSNPKGATKPNAAQYQALLEEARLISQPHSPVSQESRSSSSRHSESSKKSHSRNLSRSSQKSQSSQKSRSTKETPASSKTKDLNTPRGLTRAGSDRSLGAVNGSVSSRASSTSRRPKSSNRLGTSRDAVVPQTRSHQGEPARGEKVRAPPIQIPQVPIEADTIPTPTGPSPTPLAVRPKLAIPEDAHKRPTKVHIPTPYPSAEPASHTSRVHNRQDPMRQRNEISTPVTAFDDMTPHSPNRFFWIPSDTLLRTPIEPRAWTPARADSPTLSTNISATSQAYAKIAGRVETQQIGPQEIRQELASPIPQGGIRTTRTPMSSLRQVTESQPTSKRAVSTSSKNGAVTKALSRSDSPFANRPDWAAIAERLEALSPRPGSAAANKTTSFSSRPGSSLAHRIGANGNASDVVLTRPSSPKSRNASVSRAANPIDIDDPLEGQRKENMSRASIRIGASASVLDDGRAGDHIAGYENADINHHQARAQSRGRPGAPSVQMGPGTAGRALPSLARETTPSLGGAQVHRAFASEARQNSRLRLGVFLRNGPLDGTGDENEIIGEIIVRRSPNCVVHGRPQVAEPDASEPNDSQGVGGDTEGRATPQTTEAVTSKGIDPTKTEDNFKASVPSPAEDTENRQNGDTPPVETLLTPRSFSSPQSLFYPRTPKAMILGREDDSSILATPLTGLFGQGVPNDMTIKL